MENSIDAGAKNVSIVRGRQDGDQYLRIVGEECVLVSQGKSGQPHSMRLSKGNPSFAIRELSTLLPQPGTELSIKPLLQGVRMLSGEKIQNYLASELRDRITKSGVRIRISDRTARKELIVEPRKYRGRLLHELEPGPAPQGEVYVELYLADPQASAGVSLCKQGTRIIPDIRRLEDFDRPPWNSALLEGLIDAPFLQLTPGTRDGVVLDDSYESLLAALEPIESAIVSAIEEQRKAEDEEASREYPASKHGHPKALKPRKPRRSSPWTRNSRRAPRAHGGAGALRGIQSPENRPCVRSRPRDTAFPGGRICVTIPLGNIHGSAWE